MTPTLEALMALGALLFVKHLIFDGPLQSDWHVANKGVFGHPAGLSHASLHGLGSVIVIAFWAAVLGYGDAALVAISALAALICAEIVIHYFIDFLKCQVDSRFQWTETAYSAEGRRSVLIRDKTFFTAFLTDQTFHSLTYLLMVYAVGRLL